MNGAELFGRVLKVNISKGDNTSRGGNRPVWETQADKFFNAAGGDEGGAGGDEGGADQAEP